MTVALASNTVNSQAPGEENCYPRLSTTLFGSVSGPPRLDQHLSRDPPTHPQASVELSHRIDSLERRTVNTLTMSHILVLTRHTYYTLAQSLTRTPACTILTPICFQYTDQVSKYCLLILTCQARRHYPTTSSCTQLVYVCVST